MFQIDRKRLPSNYYKGWFISSVDKFCLNLYIVSMSFKILTWTILIASFIGMEIYITLEYCKQLVESPQFPVI